MVKTIDKLLKDAITANKYKCGTREVLRSIRGSKLIVLSSTVRTDVRAKIESEAKQDNIPVYPFDGNSFRLGKLCNKPFRINAIALKAATDAQIDSVLSDIQKLGPSSTTQQV
ncbi:MAG: ribosomal L7Ae/L30e/S12e/Gadd45 family protein [Nitrososphaeraceae archaeon]